MKVNYNKFSFENEHAIISVKRETFVLTDSGKTWKAKPIKTETEKVSCEFYTNCVQSIPFFNHFFGHREATCKATWNYTVFGYIPVKIVTYNPGKTEKRVMTFTFEYNH